MPFGTDNNGDFDFGKAVNDFCRAERKAEALSNMGLLGSSSSSRSTSSDNLVSYDSGSFYESSGPAFVHSTEI